MWLNTTVSPCWRLLANISEFRPRNSIGAVPAYKVAVMFPLTCSTYGSICVVNPRRIFLAWMVLLGFLENWKLWNPVKICQNGSPREITIWVTVLTLKVTDVTVKWLWGHPRPYEQKKYNPEWHMKNYTYIYINNHEVYPHISTYPPVKKIEHVQSYTIIYIHVHMLHAIYIYNYIYYIYICACVHVLWNVIHVHILRGTW